MGIGVPFGVRDGDRLAAGAARRGWIDFVLSASLCFHFALSAKLCFPIPWFSRFPVEEIASFPRQRRPSYAFSRGQVMGKVTA